MSLKVSNKVFNHKLSLYIYKHLQTSEIMVSRTQALKTWELNQLGNLGTKVLRKDLWCPILVLTGFDNSTTIDSIWKSLITYPKPIREENFKNFTIKQRRVMDKNQVQHKLDALCRILIELPNFVKNRHIFPEKMNSEDLKIFMLWETEYWMNLIKKSNLEWPEYLEHSKLVLMRGRIILNEGLMTCNKNMLRRYTMSKIYAEENVTTVYPKDTFTEAC